MSQNSHMELCCVWSKDKVKKGSGRLLFFTNVLISVHVYTLLFTCCEVCRYSEVAGCNQWKQSCESHDAYQVLEVSTNTKLRCYHVQYVGRKWAG